jgi:cytochrome c551/c552
MKLREVHMRLIGLMVLVLSIGSWAAYPYAWAGDGGAIFESLTCSRCHKPDKKAAAVSLAEIAKTYGDNEKLVKFLKGETKPLIESEKWGMMKGQFSKITPLSDQEKSDLAEYILSFK